MVSRCPGIDMDPFPFLHSERRAGPEDALDPVFALVWSAVVHNPMLAEPLEPDLPSPIGLPHVIFRHVSVLFGISVQYAH